MKKVIDYLLSNEINETIIKIKMMDKITSDDLKELERIPVARIRVPKMIILM